MEHEVEFLKERLKELEELTQLSQALSSTIEVDETLRTIIESCSTLCRASYALLSLLDPQSSEIVKTLVRSREHEKPTLDHRLHSLITGWVITNKQALRTENILELMKYKNPPESIKHIGPVLALPLAIEGKTIGVLSLANRLGERSFSDDTYRVAQIVSSLAAQFIRRARLHETLFEDNVRLKTELQRQFGNRTIVGETPAIKEVMNKVSIVASSTATVLLIGETGTGKELIARAIHTNGNRASKPYIAINCAAIPASLFESELFGHERGAFTGALEKRLGKFELANHGTIFLDEISEMPGELQPKLLRVLEERTFTRVGSAQEIQLDIRLIAATSVDLPQAVHDGKFREALFHRLNVIPLHLPPLRERREDIPLLANVFMEEFSRGLKHFSPDGLKFLQQREWKGNIRELRNTVERISIFVPSKEITSEQITSLGIAPEIKSTETNNSLFDSMLSENQSGEDVLSSLEKKMVQLAINKTSGNISQAAKLLGIDRNALQRRLEKFGL
ncbi:MAG: sigma-54-dependent Fis family transcriptional regulator [Ignavibacteriae bacterium]|nr:sigma-54-dependent Fis family transcriptional regulator [Ignavibacteriota bacterium]